MTIVYMIERRTMAFNFLRISNLFEGNISAIELVSKRIDGSVYQKGVVIINSIKYKLFYIYIYLIMYLFVLLVLFIVMISFKEGYLNYQEIPLSKSTDNCPQTHANNYQVIKNSRQMMQPFGYTKNELFDMTRFIKTDIPLPTDPDFFKHI